MIIHKLELTSFGKFQQKVLTFEDGFNIVEGDNEVGKTTIHKFIEGMFFGFLDPTKSRRSYTTDHAKYQPKNASSYRGSITITIDQKRYRIDRNFDKKQADVTVYDDQNGEDITHKLQSHPSTKLPDLAEFIGISYKLYQNTISTAQLLRNTESDLGKALIERLHNITTTKDESISIQKVHEELDKSLSDIGSSQAKTKPYAKAIKKVEDLEEQIAVSKEKYDTSEKLYKEKNNKLQEVEQTQTNLSNVDKDIFQYYNTKKKDQHKLASELKKQLEYNHTKINTHSEVLTLEEEDFEQLLQLKNELQHEQQKKAERKSTLTDLEEKIKEYDKTLSQQPAFSSYNYSVYEFRDLFYARNNTLEDIDDLKEKQETVSQHIASIHVNEDLIKDHQHIERLKEEKEELDVLPQEQKVHLLQEDYLTLENKNYSMIVTILYYLLYVLVIGYFLQKKRKEKIQKHHQAKAQVKEALLLAKNKLEEVQEKQKTYTEMIDQLLDKHEVSQVYELSERRRTEEQKRQTLETFEKQKADLLEQLKKKKTQFNQLDKDFKKHCELLDIAEFSDKKTLDDFEERYQKHQQLNQQKKQTEEAITKTNSQVNQSNKLITKLEQDYLVLLKQNKMETIEHFKSGLKLKQEMTQLQKENDQLHQRISDLTSGQTMEDFEKDIVFNLDDYQGNKSIKELEEEQTTLRKELRNLESTTYELEKEISVIEETYMDVYTLTGLHKKATQELAELSLQKDALELAGSVIDELSKEIQYEFAPSLNKAISEVMNDITDGKYHDLKIDPETNVKIVDDHLKQLLQAEDFSTGTIDQIYFSMRLGLSSILFNHQFPFILDDTFVNYDATRLSRVLTLLSKEDRQVLLFTCHKREHVIAEQETISHHYTQLT